LTRNASIQILKVEPKSFLLVKRDKNLEVTMFKKYKWNFVFIVLIVSLLGFIIFDLIFYHNIRNYLYDQTFNDMRIKTQLAVSLFEERHLQDLTMNNPGLYEISYQIRNIVNSRVTIIDSTGKVLSDSDVAQDRVLKMDNHINRPEIKAAMADGWGQSYRMSDTVKR
jgi:two-component system phosphate regulon sensor histidine kinase PhoR